MISIHEWYGSFVLVEIILDLGKYARATGKHGNAGTETGTETTKRCGEREPISWPYSRQESQISHEQAPHWVHSSIRKLYQGDIAASSSWGRE